MEQEKKLSTMLSIIMAILLLGSTFSNTSTVVNASTSLISQHINPITGQPYGDIMQYDWPLIGHDSGNTRFNPGPAPNRPDVLWTFRRPGGGAVSGGPPTAFDGKIFTYGGGRLYALNPFTGAIIYDVPLNGTPIGFGPGAIFKIDGTYMGHISSDRISVYKISDGSWVTTRMVTTADGISTLIAGEVLYWGAFFYQEYKLALTAARNLTTNTHTAVAWDLSNPTAGITIAWTCPLPTGVEALGAGGGLAFYGGYAEGELFAINVTTGKLAWRNWKVGDCGYSIIYYNDKVYHTAGSTRVTCYDAKTGEMLWDVDLGPRAYHAFGGAAAYGMIFDKSMAPGRAFVAAYDAETGEMIWKQPAHYSITYAVPVVADGKVYVQTCDQASTASVAGIPSPGYSTTCFDAFTGQVIWKVPINFAYPMVAYGNFYGISGGTLYCIGERSDPWNMFGGPPSNYGVAVGTHAPSDISTPAWFYQASGPIVGSPVVADGKVFFGSYDGSIYCIDAYSGSLIWKFPTGYRIGSTPAVVDGKVYTGADDGNIYCIDANTGQQVWKKFAGGVTEGPLLRTLPQWRSSPFVTGGRLYVGAMDGKVYCLNTANGDIVWSYTATNRTYGIASSPFVYKGVVYIGTGNGSLYALNAANGALVWRRQLTATDRRLVGSPIVINDPRGGEMLVIGSDTGGFMGGRRMYFINITDGANLFYVDLTLVGMASAIMAWRPAYRYNGTYGILYISENMYVSAWAIINSTYAERQWSQWVGHVIYSSAVYADDITGGKVYVGNNANSLICFDATSGKPISSYSSGAPIYGTAAIYEGKVYIGSYDGRLYCFSDKPVAETDIVAWCDWKQSNVGETIVIQGKLRAVTVYDTAKFNPKLLPEQSIVEVWYPGIPNATVKVTFVKPDGSQEDVTTKTDSRGLFTVSYTPTVAGNWTWTAWYEGEDKITHAYSYAYTADTPLEVLAPSEEHPPPPLAFSTELAAAIIIIVIIIIVIAVYILKKPKK
ncbi:MAG: PQQ-binding-like beta-propeller repeat protein [Candidatus Bathyarchaeia archaeon]|jgi:outer membrane protein assembly factor BamB|nr:PQQ-binding-like beta-propeller repeat protein [Candidatus Bathyarchaeota archaeon A05DMB-3]